MHRRNHRRLLMCLMLCTTICIIYSIMTQPTWHYNGGKILLQEVITPIKRGGVSTFARPIKWVFTVHIGKSALSTSFANQVKVAVMSARARTTLVPICITTAHANSEFSQWLVSHRVRVISHTPRWAEKATSTIVVICSEMPMQ